MSEKISILDAALFGLTQGATEFLPISSSGHLSLLAFIFTDLPDPREAVAFFIVLHFATLLAVLLVFRREIASLAGANSRALPGILVGTIPIAAIYLLAGPYLEAAYTSLSVVGTCFLGTGVFLWLSERGWEERKDLSHLTLLDAGLIGIAQALAILPGLSRSGLTISVARMRRSSRPAAASFSFLLSIPAIAGAMIVKTPALANLPAIADFPAIIVGFLSAFATGVGLLVLLLRVIRSGKFFLFAPYVVVLGIVSLVMGLFS